MDNMQEMNTNRREYPLKTLQKILLFLVSTLFFAGSGFFFILAINPVGREFSLFMGAVFLLPNFYLIPMALRSRIVINGCRIEVHYAFRKCSVNRDEIEGLHNFIAKGSKTTQICLKEGRGNLFISGPFENEDEIQNWLKGLPDIDQLPKSSTT